MGDDSSGDCSKKSFINKHLACLSFLLALISMLSSCTTDSEFSSGGSRNDSESEFIDSFAASAEGLTQGNDGTITQTSDEEPVEEGETFSNESHGASSSSASLADSESSSLVVSIENDLRAGFCQAVALTAIEGSDSVIADVAIDVSIVNSGVGHVYGDRDCRETTSSTSITAGQSGTTVYFRSDEVGEVVFEATVGNLENWNAGTLTMRVSAPSWSDVATLDEGAGIVRDDALLIKEDDGGSAYALYAQGQDLYLVWYSATDGWQSATAVESAPGRVESFDLGVESSTGGTGSAFVAWTQGDLTTGKTIAYAKRYSPSFGWGTLKTLSNASYDAQYVKIAANSSEAVAVWAEKNGSTYNSYYALYSSSTASFESAIALESSAASYIPRVAPHGPTNGFSVSYVTTNSSNEYVLKAKRYDANAGSWQEAQTFANLGTTLISSDDFMLVGSSSDTVAVGWKANSGFYVMYGTGSTWQGSSSISLSDSTNDVYQASIGMDMSGNAYAAWIENAGDYKLFSASAAMGSSFGSTTEVGTASNSVGIGFSSTGLGLVSFKSGYTLKAYRYDPVTSWSAEEEIGSLQSNRNPLQSVAIDSSDRAWVAAVAHYPVITAHSALVAASYDGSTWTEPARINTEISTLYHARGGFLASGDIAVLWEGPGESVREARYRSYHSSSGWGEEVTLDSGKGVHYPRLATTSSGAVALYVEDSNSDGSFEPRVRTLGSAGSWSESQALSSGTDNTGPAIEVVSPLDEGSSTLAAWELNGTIHVVSSSDAESWGSETTLSSSALSEDVPMPAFINSHAIGCVLWSQSSQAYASTRKADGTWIAGSEVGGGNGLHYTYDENHFASTLFQVVPNELGGCTACWMTATEGSNGYPLICNDYDPASESWGSPDSVGEIADFVMVGNSRGERVLAAWVGPDSEEEYSLYVARFTPSGGWIARSDAVASGVGSVLGRTRASINEAAVAVVAWTAAANGTGDLNAKPFAIRLVSESWEEPSTIDSGEGDADLLDVTVGRDGRALLLWREASETAGEDLKVSLLQ